jgi:ubiquinone/menaquinone biosynthesis C-methylase UbiE
MLNPFTRSTDPYMLIVGMTGVKMGDRLIQVGCEHGGRLGAIAAKVGLSGRAVAVVPDDRTADRARKGAAEAGVLVEVEVAPMNAFGIGEHAFDVAVVDDTGTLMAAMTADERGAMVGEIARVLRPGGRVVYIGSTGVRGLAALVKKSAQSAFGTSGGANQVFSAHGFKSVRTLAERDGFIFIEGVKPR